MRTRTAIAVAAVALFGALAVLLLVGSPLTGGSAPERARRALGLLWLADRTVVLAAGAAAVGLGIGIAVGTVDAYEERVR